ncbi:MAG: DUF4382 domain-containing protein [Gemmatimonadota bacterium]|nr:MAG: DUF4382 domain-containing protein [Gemmatimonadota bacterium]
MRPIVRSMRRRPFDFLVIVLTCLAPVACTTSDLAEPDDPNDPGPGGDPNPNPTVAATVVVSDASQPTGIPSLEGQLAFSGLTVELWDGSDWVLVTDQPTTAAIALGDGAADATLAQTEIPAGDYTRARLSGSGASVDLSLTLDDGRNIAASFAAPSDQTLVAETDVTVSENDDGSRTFRIELWTIRNITLQGGQLAITGDLGTVSAAASMQASVVAADGSSPGIDVTGTATFSDLTVELWDGDAEEWLLVTDQPTTVDVAIGDGTASATLMDFDDIPAGTYTKARFTAQDAVADVTANLNGQDYAAQLRPPTDEPIVIEKDVTVVVNDDGSTTFSIEFEMIRSVRLQAGPGGMILVIDGDLGSVAAAATMRAGVAAVDVSQPATVDVTGEVTFTNLTIELSADGEDWVKVSEDGGSAVVTLGDGTVAATLVPVDVIAAGEYTRIRLTATDVVIDITADIGGQEYAAQVRPSDSGPVVVEKDVEVIDNGDGSRTFIFQLECVRAIDVQRDAGGDNIVIVDGDLGSGQARVG